MAYVYEEGYVSYAIQVWRAGADRAATRWVVHRRYSEFVKLHKDMLAQQQAGAIASVAFPAKGAPNKSDAQLERRRQQLDAVLQAVLSMQPLRPQLRSWLRAFLDADKHIRLINAAGPDVHAVVNEPPPSATSPPGQYSALSSSYSGHGLDASLLKFWLLLLALVVAAALAQPLHAVAITSCFFVGVFAALASARHDPLRVGDGPLLPPMMRGVLAVATGDTAARTPPPPSRGGASASVSGNASASAGSGGGDALFVTPVQEAMRELMLVARSEDPVQDGWRDNGTNDEIRVFLKTSGSNVATMGRGVLPAPPRVVATVMATPELKPRYDLNWRATRTLQDIQPAAASGDGASSSATRVLPDGSEETTTLVRVEHSTFNKVLITSPRDLVCSLLQVVTRKGGRVTCIATALTSVDHPGAPPTPQQYTRAQLFVGGVVLRAVGGPGGRTHTAMTNLTRMDPGGSIPGWVTRTVAPQRAMTIARIRKLDEVASPSSWPQTPAHFADRVENDEQGAEP